VVERLKKEHGVEVTWLPLMLHPEIPAEGRPRPPATREGMEATEWYLARLAKEGGLELTWPDFSPNTRRAHEATEYAREFGKIEEFHRAVFYQYHGLGEDIGQWPALREAAVEAGLDPDDMQRQTDNGAYRAALDAYLAEARARGVKAVPSYVLNDRITIVGAQEYGEFQRVMRKLGGKK
jgi:predicted DsbA family dithiol-disulfide isomerase